nr:reverse transcriptase domain-containing protein [Tanacetum cinerariifolium]
MYHEVKGRVDGLAEEVKGLESREAEEFIACHPKEYDGKGGFIVYSRWIEKIESVQDMSGYGNDQKLKYTAGSFISKALTRWNFHIRTQGRETIVGMACEDFKSLMRVEFCSNNKMQKLETELWNHVMVRAGHVAYTNRFHELARLVHHLVTLENRRIERIGSLKRNLERRGNGGEHSRDRNEKDDNKRTRTRNAFATTANRDFAKDCKMAPRMVNPVNAKNPTTAHEACFECGGTNFKATCRGNNGNQTHGRAFMLGAEEARQDPNIVTGIEPSNLDFNYEIEIASGQLVEINKKVPIDREILRPILLQGFTQYGIQFLE